MVAVNEIQLVPSTEFLQDNGQFYLVKPELFELQQYRANVIALPTSFEQLNMNHQDLSPEVKQVIEEILKTYLRMQDHVEYWRVTFEHLVEVAGEVFYYSQLAKGYFPEMRKSLIKIQNLKPSTPEQRREIEKFQKMANKLRDDAQDGANKTKEVEVRLKKFMEDTEQDKNDLKNWGDRLKELLPTIGETIQNIQSQIETAETVITSAQSLITNQAASLNDIPKYVWVPVWGWIAGGVVYGQATAAIEQARQDIDTNSKKIEDLREQLNKEQRVQSMMNNKEAQVQRIRKQIEEKVLPAIQTIYSEWKSMADDMDDLKTWVNEMIVQQAAQEDFDILDVNLDIADDKWIEIGKKANDYRAKAFVEFSKADTVLAS
jgi:DNA repair exonuclease SbcCD ATPase subunit